MNKFVLTVLAAVFLFSPSAFASSGWLIYHEHAFEGKVVDAETKKPIEGAVVVAMYKIREYSFVQSDAVVADVKEALTDTHGEFRIPQHTFFSIYPVARGETTTFLIFKPGYASISELSLGDIFSGEGKEGELPWIGNRDLKFTFAPGLVGLPRVRNREERLQAIPGHFTDADNKTPFLNRLIEEEDRALKLKK